VFACEQVNDVGYGRKFEVRCATHEGDKQGKKKQRLFQLEACNVESRDAWTHHIQ
jgi:hypothetical protein